MITIKKPHLRFFCALIRSPVIFGQKLDMIKIMEKTEAKKIIGVVYTF